MNISQIVFIILLISAIALFTRNVRKIIRNINLGKKLNISDHKPKRWNTMFRVALGQSKMVTRPIAGFFHILIYVGFIIINIEVLEIIIDGAFGTHRILSNLLPAFLYNFLIGGFEVLAVGVLAACIVFLSRRYIVHLKRFWSKEMTTWPRLDATIILVTEIFLMCFFLTMNASDHILQDRGYGEYFHAGAFPVSSIISNLILKNYSSASLAGLERFCWWAHIVGILVFLNYIIFSKHFHIVISFPNVYYSKLTPAGQFTNLESVTREVKLMLDPSAPPPAAPAEPERFGAKDVRDLSWKQLMDSYSCTECGRCTSSCPANQTGKKLSPRKIMMDTRDRLEQLGMDIDKHGLDFTGGKTLLGDYITEEELLACTTCNACVQECPVDIDPLSIITDLRRNLVMEESKINPEWTAMLSNIENNGAPWKFSPSDRMNWTNGMEIPTMADMHSKGEVPEVLFFVGCSGSFDDRAKSITRSFAKILASSNTSFAVLGLEETCTGDPAKRAGNEFLFQMQAMQNIQTMNNYGVKKVVTACPHCFNTIKNEYPELGGSYEVLHHSTLLKQLIDEGKLKVNEQNAFNDKTITYHDSCYLGRGNGVYEAPRSVIESLKTDIKEMKHSKQKGLCCGAGGAQMFKEEEKGNKRISTERAEQALETGATIVASACPFCMTMMSDGVKTKLKEQEVKVYDIAELVATANGLN